MKVLFFRYKSICESGMLKAFHQYGIETDEVMEIDKKNNKLPPKEIVQKIDHALSANNYSFVFSINFNPHVSNVCNVYQIPYMCLIVDSPVLSLYSEAIKNDCNRIFLFDRALYNEFHQYNPTRIFHIPLATDVQHMDKIIASNNTNKFACDISFVGSLYTEKTRFSLKNSKDEYLNGYIDALIEAQLKIYGCYFIDNIITDELADKLLKLMPVQYFFTEDYRADYKALISQYYLGYKISAEERVRTFKALSSKYNIDLYTGSDTSELPLINNRGLADSNKHMPLIFNRSSINLNITAKSIRSGIPLRVFDILACGGFALSNYQAEIPEFFTVGEHLDVYESIEDLDDKIHYYLEHPSIRKEMAQAGYEYVKNNHTYTIRLAQMISIAFK